jgi:hypothetical protein
VWTLLADEITTHPDKSHPHSEYHRNPLFRFVNNSQRLYLVPEHLATSKYEVALFTFIGKLMGHMVRARTPIAVDFSPFVWKFLVEDPLTVKDYFLFVDSVVEKSLDDEDFLVSEVAADVIPSYSAALAKSGASLDLLSNEKRRSIASDCLLHCMDLQLNAMREGLWATLPRRITRCLCWRDLERAVAGEADPTFQHMKDNISLSLVPPALEQLFWKLMEEMTGAQRSQFLCFACGQRRVPLVKTIRVTMNAESADHLPRAQSCSSLVTIPHYTTYDTFKEKMLLALEHQLEMELA